MKTKLTRIAFLVANIMMMAIGVAHADPLDDAAASLGRFLQKVGTHGLWILPTAGAAAILAVVIKRMGDKMIGSDDHVMQRKDAIPDILKLTAIGFASSLLVAIAGSVLT